MKNTRSQTTIPPVLVILILALILHVSVSGVYFINRISSKEYIIIVSAIYLSMVLVGALMHQVDKWLTRYEQNRYVVNHQKTLNDEALFEAVLKREAYKKYKQTYLQDKNRKAILVKMVAEMQAEFESKIRAEAKAIVDKGQPVPLNNVQNSPIDTFLKKHSEVKTSVERAAEIFKSDVEKTENKPA